MAGITRHKDILLPFSYTSTDDRTSDSSIYCNVVFTDKFGVFEDGEYFDSIQVNFEDGWIKAWKSNNIQEHTKEQNFKADALCI